MVVLGKGEGNNSVWLGSDARSGNKVYMDFSYPIFALLVGRKRSFKSSCLRIVTEGLLDEGNGLSTGFLPKPLIFDPIGNLNLDRPNPQASDVAALSFDNIKTLASTDGSLKVPFSSLRGEDILSVLGITERCVLQRRTIRTILNEAGEGASKKEFVEMARVYAFELPNFSMDSFETKIDSLERDRAIVDDVADPLEYLKEYRGLRVDLSALLPSDRARADFFCNYFVNRISEARNRARVEEIKYGLGEPAEPLLGPVCIIVDELNRVSPKPFFDLIRISGNLGISVVLASQAIRDFGSSILGERDVTFCGKLVNRDDVRRASTLVPVPVDFDLITEIPRLGKRNCIAWNEHDGAICNVCLREPATFHYGMDENVEKFRGLYL